MRRTVTWLVVAASFAGSMAGAETAHERNCATMADATDRLVTMRKEGTEQMEALKQVLEVRAIKNSPAKDALPGMAAWVFSLPKAQLTKDVAVEFERQCNGHKG